MEKINCLAVESAGGALSRSVVVLCGTGTPPPNTSWKLLGFQDERMNGVLLPATVVHRLAGRLKH